MEYRLEVYASGGRNQDNCIKVFTSTAPFAPLHIGDLLDASGWGHAGAKILRVLSVEHEKSPLVSIPRGESLIELYSTPRA